MRPYLHGGEISPLSPGCAIDGADQHLYSLFRVVPKYKENRSELGRRHTYVCTHVLAFSILCCVVRNWPPYLMCCAVRYWRYGECGVVTHRSLSDHWQDIRDDTIAHIRVCNNTGVRDQTYLGMKPDDASNTHNETRASQCLPRNTGRCICR